MHNSVRCLTQQTYLFFKRIILFKKSIFVESWSAHGRTNWTGSASPAYQHVSNTKPAVMADERPGGNSYFKILYGQAKQKKLGEPYAQQCRT